jgi:UPF0755 protein
MSNKKKIKKISFLIVMIALLVGGVLAWWIRGTSAVDPNDQTQKTFTVRRGENVRTIANNLKDAGLINDPVIFFLVVKQLNLDHKIQAGEFLLSPSLNAFKIAKTLQIATNDAIVVIPEGRRAEEIADILKEKISSYDESWREALTTHEGYLFPDTYFFSKDASIETIISTLRKNFDEKYNSIEGIENSSLSQQEIVTIASMVEREAKHDKDRPLVASVILNRYEIGMKLDIDATIQYALGFQENEKRWWKEGLTLSDLRLNSPYNTYLTASLPPTPISNPGIEALQSVVTPAKTDYLFYISDKNGNNHYAKTNEEHEENKRRFGL